MDAAKLVSTYIKIRDAKSAMEREHEEQLKTLTDQMDALESELLEICKATGQEGGKTEFGSFTRTVKTRYWTSDWDSMYTFVKEHEAPELLEKRQVFHHGSPCELSSGITAPTAPGRCHTIKTVFREPYEHKYHSLQSWQRRNP